MISTPMKPIRIQRKRTKGYKLPPDTVCVTRPGKYGNPFTGIEAIDAYRRLIAIVTAGQNCQVSNSWTMRRGDGPRYAMERPPDHCRVAGQKFDCRFNHKFGGFEFQGDVDFLKPLFHRNLACFCPLDKPCHADVLLEFAAPWR